MDQINETEQKNKETETKANGILKIAICDDEESALEIIASAITTAFKNHAIRIIIDKYASVVQLERVLSELNYDLLLLDIKMKNRDGVVFARRLREKNIDIPIIFVSSQEERVFETFEVKPFGFIRKSHFLKDVVNVIDGFVESLEDSAGEKIVLKVNGKLMNVSAGNMMYIESFGREQNIYLSGRKEPLIVTHSMREFEDQLCGYGFIRVHKSYLVNYRFIALVGNGEVELTDGKTLPVGRTYEKTLKQKFLRLVSKRGSVVF